MSDMMPTCGHCGTTSGATIGTFFTLCATCYQNIATSTSGWKAKMQSLEAALANEKARASMLSDAISALEEKASSATYQMKSYQSAASGEGQERLEIRAQRDMARTAIEAWKQLYEHWKGRNGCPHCVAEPSNHVPCPIMKLHETNCLASTPKYECESCKEKTDRLAEASRTLEKYGSWKEHQELCDRCGAKCPDGVYLLDAFITCLSMMGNDPHAKRLVRNLARSIDDFSYFGPGTAVLYDEMGEYTVIKLDLRKVKVESSMMLGRSDTLKGAIDNAKSNLPAPLTATGAPQG